MTVSAKLNREYAVRTVAVGLIMLGFCGWSLYDGWLAYPEDNRRFEAVRAELLALDATPAALLQVDAVTRERPVDAPYKARGWATPKKLAKELAELRERAAKMTGPDPAQAAAAQRRWLRELLEKPLRSRNDIQVQNVMALVTGIWSGALLLSLAAKARRRFTADDTGLAGFRPQPIRYEEIVALDLGKWAGKGIAKLRVRTPQGGEAILVLDDWHFRGMGDLLKAIEERRPDLAPAAAPPADSAAGGAAA